MSIFRMEVEKIETFRFEVEAEDYLQAEQYAVEMSQEYPIGDTVDYWVSGEEVIDG